MGKSRGEGDRSLLKGRKVRTLSRIYAG